MVAGGGAVGGGLGHTLAGAATAALPSLTAYGTGRLLTNPGFTRRVVMGSPLDGVSLGRLLAGAAGGIGPEGQ